jgi:AraC family transcriptional regulator
MDAGEGWVLPAGLPGKARWYQELDFMNVHISASALSRINDGKLPQYEARSQVRDPTFVQLAVNLHEIAEADETILKMYRDTMMFALAAHVNHVWGGVRRELLTQRVDSRIRRAIDYIEAHLETDISLEKLASVAAMSPYHFSRIFKSATGLPPHRFLASRRINRAKPLLKTTNLPIVEIAYRVGYADVSHFTQLFKRITGGTPGNFRNAA